MTGPSVYASGAVPSMDPASFFVSRTGKAFPDLADHGNVIAETGQDSAQSRHFVHSESG